MKARSSMSAWKALRLSQMLHKLPDHVALAASKDPQGANAPCELKGESNLEVTQRYIIRYYSKLLMRGRAALGLKR